MSTLIRTQNFVSPLTHAVADLLITFDFILRKILTIKKLGIGHDEENYDTHKLRGLLRRVFEYPTQWQHTGVTRQDVRAQNALALKAEAQFGIEVPEAVLDKQFILYYADQAKTKKVIPVPLNSEAMTVLQRQVGKHGKYVFTYQGTPVNQCNTKAWRHALARAGIENFRWHDLRHTWASWHVQNGTRLQELQQLGGWSSFEMVLRYAHLSSDHLRDAAERITRISGNEALGNGNLENHVTFFLQSAATPQSQLTGNH